MSDLRLRLLLVPPCRWIGGSLSAHVFAVALAFLVLIPRLNACLHGARFACRRSLIRRPLIEVELGKQKRFLASGAFLLLSPFEVPVFVAGIFGNGIPSQVAQSVVAWSCVRVVAGLASVWTRPDKRLKNEHMYLLRDNSPIDIERHGKIAVSLNRNFHLPKLADLPGRSFIAAFSSACPNSSVVSDKIEWAIGDRLDCSGIHEVYFTQTQRGVQ